MTDRSSALGKRFGSSPLLRRTSRALMAALGVTMGIVACGPPGGKAAGKGGVATATSGSTTVPSLGTKYFRSAKTWQWTEVTKPYELVAEAVNARGEVVTKVRAWETSKGRHQVGAEGEGQQCGVVADEYWNREILLRKSDNDDCDTFLKELALHIRALGGTGGQRASLRTASFEPTLAIQADTPPASGGNGGSVGNVGNNVGVCNNCTVVSGAVDGTNSRSGDGVGGAGGGGAGGGSGNEPGGLGANLRPKMLKYVPKPNERPTASGAEGLTKCPQLNLCIGFAAGQAAGAESSSGGTPSPSELVSCSDKNNVDVFFTHDGQKDLSSYMKLDHCLARSDQGGECTRTGCTGSVGVSRGACLANADSSATAGTKGRAWKLEGPSAGGMDQEFDPGNTPFTIKDADDPNACLTADAYNQGKKIVTASCTENKERWMYEYVSGGSGATQ